jgi:hypothetical protein
MNLTDRSEASLRSIAADLASGKLSPADAAALFATSDQILSSDDIKREYIPCVEWGCIVMIQSPTGTERDEFEDSLVTLKKTLRNGKVKVERETFMRGARGKALAIGARHLDGRRMFTDAQAKELGEKNAKPLHRCFEAFMRLAGMTEEEVENLGNDSGSEGQSDGSTSDSR